MLKFSGEFHLSHSKMKKSLERIYAEWFVSDVGWKECQIRDSEQPDFIIGLKDKKIGLEVTNLYKDEGRKGSPQKTQESLNIKWLQSLASEYYKQHSVPIRVQVLISKGQTLPAPSDLVEEIAKEIPNSDMAVAILEKNQSQNIKIKLYIRRLPVSFKQYKRWTFVNNHVGWVGKVSKEAIQTKIDIKKHKSLKYQKDIDKLILLIIIDSSTESGMLSLPSDNIDYSCKEFDEIFLVKHLIKIKKIG